MAEAMKVVDMPAGPKLDALIAEKVMGWGHWDDPDYPDAPYPMSGDFAPSLKIGITWEVVEKLAPHWWLELYGGDGNWKAVLRSCRNKGVVPIRHSATATTAPLAICRAAILAKGITEV